MKEIQYSKMQSAGTATGRQIGLDAAFLYLANIYPGSQCFEVMLTWQKIVVPKMKRDQMPSELA